MTYRDDRDADQARIAALEADLAAANQRIAELEGRREQALVLASGGNALTAPAPGTAAKRWFGAPLQLELTRRFGGTFPTDRFEDLIERIRAIVRDPGRSELLRSSLTWSATPGEKSIGPFLVVTVSVKDGATTLTVTDRLGQAAGAIYGGIGGGVGGGAIVAPIFASIAVPVLAPVFVLGWLGGVYAGARAIFKRVARRRAERLQVLFDALAEEIATRIAQQG
ncbi:MAG TPA: hypothetical protein VFQ53_17145 [Kofleriaceae bacterium]|nr:hypothetical protein [Kofleriaceae bacterium]